MRAKPPKARLTGHGKEAPNGAAAGFVALSLLTAPNRARMPKPDDGPPCHLCTARCCKYFAFGIDRPTAKKDYEYIRWYLMHEGIVVWVEDGDWYIEVRTVCKNLQPDNTCAIYETRPQVCQEYGIDEPCEYFTDDVKYDLYFDSDKKFEVWAQAEMEKKSRKRRAAYVKRKASAARA